MSACLKYAPHKITSLYYRFLKCIHWAFRPQNISEVWILKKFSPYLSPTNHRCFRTCYTQTRMTVMYVDFPFTIFVTTSSPDWARDSSLIITTKYDWPGIDYTRLGQTTINFNGTSLGTTTIIHLAPSWHISYHWLHVLPVRPHHRLYADVGLHAQVAHVVLNEITNGANSVH
jgi:hypothetical protein